MVDRLLSQWFCFIQTDDGKVVAVQHGSDEKQSAIDLKKSIAAAFQANFRGTEEEIESDPQSEHIAHYKYVPHSYCINFIFKICHFIIGMNEVLAMSKRCTATLMVMM